MIDTTVNQRIKMLVDEFERGNKLVFSKRVGISNQALGDIIGGKMTNPSYLSLCKIAKALPKVRIEWLLLGEGEMLKTLATEDTGVKKSAVSAASSVKPFSIEPGAPSTHEGKTVPTFRVKGESMPSLPGTDLVQQVAKNTREIELMQQALETVVAELRQLASK